jgi:FixJ family two-component response regulator
MQDRRRRVVGVVDDDAAVRDSLRFLLEAAGFRVVTFPSGDQFLAAHRPDGVACLLLDQHMARMTGLELLRRLRQAGCELAVAIMTGSPSGHLRHQARELGAAVVLEKPLTEQLLFRFVGNPLG